MIDRVHAADRLYDSQALLRQVDSLLDEFRAAGPREEVAVELDAGTGDDLPPFPRLLLRAERAR